MVPMIDEQNDRITGFYDQLAEDFDRMTAIDKRLVSERPFYRLLIEQNDIHSALDAGAGTGFHSLMLAHLGVKVMAVDVSGAMLDILSRHATERHLPITTVRSSFQELPLKYQTTADGVFSMGNTLAHVLSHEELGETLGIFQRFLRPGGTIVLQIVNFDRILGERQSVQHVRESEGVTFLRYYEFKDPLILFHVRIVDQRTGQVEERHSTVPLSPWTSEDLLRHMKLAGFRDVKIYGSIALDRFKADTSKDIVVVAKTRS